MAKSSKPESTKKPSESPPSSRVPPPTGGSGPYAMGAAALALAIGVLLYVKCSAEDESPKPPPEPVTTAASTASQTADLPDFAPPPPPEEEEDAGAAKPKPTGPAQPGSGPSGACSQCGKGVPSSALTSAVSSTAGLARGCYNRALRTGGAEGSLLVSVSVGADGSLCNASIAQDSLNNPGVSACVVGKFRSRSYPPPKQGCVVVNVPINFKMKK